MDSEWQTSTRRGDVETARRLLEAGADIDARDQHGQTALMNAAHAGQVDLVRLLVERGADLNVTAKYNLSALMLALIGRHIDVERLLIEAGADVILRSSANFGSQTALGLAEASGEEEIVQMLRARGAGR